MPLRRFKRYNSKDGNFRLGSQALGAERRRSPSLAVKVLMLLSRISQSFSAYTFVGEVVSLVSLFHSLNISSQICPMAPYSISYNCHDLQTYLPRPFIDTTGRCAVQSCLTEMVSSYIQTLFSFQSQVKTNSLSKYDYVARPTVWNSRNDDVNSVGSLVIFRRHFKTHLLFWHPRRHRRIINPLMT